MNNKLISIIIGVVLIVVIGILVYVNKKPSYVPANNTDTTQNTPNNSQTNTTPTTNTGITLAEVALHNSRNSCWSAINGSVYDLTSWIPNHPGGEQAILSLCGIDGGAGYSGQHGSSSKPARALGGFKLGTLAN